MKEIKALDMKSAGCDEILSYFIVNCVETFAKPLCNMLNKSMNEGVVPEIKTIV